jgi:hypothetical protein
MAEEAIDRTGRSAHPLLAAVAQATLDRDKTATRAHRENLLGIRNDYNRRYPELDSGLGDFVWFPDVISASWH